MFCKAKNPGNNNLVFILAVFRTKQKASINLQPESKMKKRLLLYGNYNPLQGAGGKIKAFETAFQMLSMNYTTGPMGCSMQEFLLAGSEVMKPGKYKTCYRYFLILFQ